MCCPTWIIFSVLCNFFYSWDDGGTPVEEHLMFESIFKVIFTQVRSWKTLVMVLTMYENSKGFMVY